MRFYFFDRDVKTIRISMMSQSESDKEKKIEKAAVPKESGATLDIIMDGDKAAQHPVEKS